MTLATLERICGGFNLRLILALVPLYLLFNEIGPTLWFQLLVCHESNLLRLHISAFNIFQQMRIGFQVE
jgi:hypothetical protein